MNAIADAIARGESSRMNDFQVVALLLESSRIFGIFVPILAIPPSVEHSLSASVYSHHLSPSPLCALDSDAATLKTVELSGNTFSLEACEVCCA